MIIYVYIYIYIYINVCVYILYIYVYIHMYIYTYICIYISCKQLYTTVVINIASCYPLQHLRPRNMKSPMHFTNSEVPGSSMPVFIPMVSARPVIH